MIKKVDHIGIAVRSIEEALKFYEDALGLKLTHTEAETEQQVVVAFLPAGESEVELVEPVESDSGIARYMEKRGEGIHHICFEVDDIDAMLDSLAAKGVELIDRHPKLGTGGKKIAFIHPRSTHGVLVELYEHVPGEKHPPSAPLHSLRYRLLIQSRAAAAGVRGFLGALRDNGRRNAEA